MKMPTAPIVNKALPPGDGGSAIKWDVVEVRDGAKVKLRFASKNSPWRQGVWLQADGGISVEGQRYGSVDLWEDTAPSIVEFVVHTSEGLLRLYNIWDKGRGRQSQSYTSGMQIALRGSTRIYSCTDVGAVPDFTRLVFKLEIE